MSPRSFPYRPGRLLALCAAWLALTAGGCGRRQVPVFHDGPRRVIVISLDSLRADHLGCYGYDKPTTPFLDELAAHQFRFARTTAPANWTLPSHVSLFTGLYPLRHGVDQETEALAETVPLLVEPLKEAGFATASFNGGGFLKADFGYDRGFDVYVSAEKMSGATEGTLEKAKAWLLENRDRDTFLFLHTYEIHVPYTPPSPWRLKFLEGRHSSVRGTTQQMRMIKQDGKVPGRNIVRDLIACYDGGIGYTDFLLGRFYRWLQEQGLDDNLLLIVSSDHGEAFWEHGQHGHNGDLLGPEVTDVPLIVALPGRAPDAPGVVIDREVSFLDIMPTVLEACDLPVPEGLDGYSLLPELIGRKVSETGKAARLGRQLEVDGEVVPLAVTEGNNYVALRAGTRAAVVHRPPHTLDRVKIWPALYDLATDPGEQQPLPPDNVLLPRFEGALRGIMARGRVAGDHAEPATVDEETRKQLEALGYI